MSDFKWRVSVERRKRKRENFNACVFTMMAFILYLCILEQG